jgi:hypothetical protein
MGYGRDAALRRPSPWPRTLQRDVPTTETDGGHRPPLQQFVSWWLSGSNISIQGSSRPFKAIKGYPSLFKGFCEKNLFLWKRGAAVVPDGVCPILRIG